MVPPSDANTFKITPQQAKYRSRIENALKDGRLTIVIGAGVSINAIAASKRRDEDGHRRALESMNWYGLLRHGLEYLVDEQIPLNDSERIELSALTTSLAETSPPPNNEELFRAASFVRRKLTESKLIVNWFDLEFEEIYERFINHDENPILDAIKELYKCGARIITTNYDDLMDRHINEKPILVDGTPAMQRFFRKEMNGICHVHGSWWDSKSVVLDSMDYERVKQNETIQQSLKNSMTGSEVLLFVGTGSGLRDPNFGDLLAWAAKWNEGLAQTHCLLAHQQEQIDIDARGLNVLKYGQSYEDLPKFLQELAKKASHHLTPRIISFPRRRAAYFVSRDEQFKKLQQALDTNDATSRTAVLTGIGGCGKSQLALEFCELAESNETHHSILWIDASNPTATEQAFATIAGQIPGVPANVADIHQTAEAVLDYISRSNLRWLLIFDNFDDPSQFQGDGIRDFWPRKRGHCSILITSRLPSASELTPQQTGIDLTRMTKDEALDLFNQNEDGTDQNHLENKQVVQRLGFHALAIYQARVYLKSSGRDSKHFLKLYEAEKDVLNEAPEFSTYKRKLSHEPDQETALTVFTTLTLSWNLIKDDSSSKADKRHLMVLLAFLDGTTVSDTLFEGYNETDKDWMVSCYQNSVWKKLKFEKVFQTFCRMSLAQLLPADGLGLQVSVHPLVQDWAKLILSHEQEYPSFVVESIKVLGHKLKRLDHFSLEQRLALTLHAEKVTANRLRYLNRYTYDAVLLKAVYHIGQLYRAQGEYKKAQENVHLALEECIKNLGQEHQDTLGFMDGLGVIHIQQGFYHGAEELFVQVVETRKRVLGQEHPDTLTSQANLASTFWNQGRWKEAEELFIQVMEIRKRVLGQEHPDTLTSQANLASTFWNQGRWKEAEELFVQVIEIGKRVLGQEHPNTLTSQANLASIYRNQGRWKEAEELFVQVIEMRMRVLGQEHPHTLTSQANLASTYRNQGRWEEAEELRVQVMDTRKRVLGEEHPYTLASIDNLASIFWDQGRWKEAEQLDVQVMEIRKRVLGQEHPDTLTSQANLASTFWNQGRWKEAEEFEVQVMEIGKRVLGQEHPDTLTSQANLASTFWNQGRWKEAEELEVQVMEIRKRVLGQEHPHTLISQANLASTFWNQGRWKEAEELEVQVAEIRKRVLGQEHPDTLTSQASLASTYRNQGRWKEAEELEVQVMEMSLRVLGQEHPDTLTSQANLASTFWNQGRWKEAEELEVQVAEMRKRVLGQEHPDTLARL
ncbi:putative tpr domain protein [Phaeomoniella chlamydospora]|uniref:Putative tpr domain protein n=1 Tax=Phaeomoniella chlamydospora TaxID=158046 RepID=A0A0G2GMP3_PHACM|nr:putative tpr domain protein [Phaeomoniella chlamydospora]